MSTNEKKSMHGCVAALAGGGIGLAISVAALFAIGNYQQKHPLLTSEGCLTPGSQVYFRSYTENERVVDFSYDADHNYAPDAIVIGPAGAMRIYLNVHNSLNYPRCSAPWYQPSEKEHDYLLERMAHERVKPSYVVRYPGSARTRRSAR